jgi:hypothetical protein
VSLFRRKRRRVADSAIPGTSTRDQRAATERAAEEWIEARRGVEVFVEPLTTVTSTTMLLVAHDGEFTRRPVKDAAAAEAFARAHTLPVYEAAVVGYPQRMRDYSRKQSILKKRARRERTDPDAG